MILLNVIIKTISNNKIMIVNQLLLILINKNKYFNFKNFKKSFQNNDNNKRKIN